MKYRQWKKNYKKKHGVNPPLELDKRKKRRLERKLAREAAQHLNIAVPDFPNLAEAMTRWANSIMPALATICEGIAAAFSNAAAGLRAMQEREAEE